jgi:predicted dehydrogenase
MSSALDRTKREQLARHQGGMAFELLCHLIDIVAYMLGRPGSVHSFLRNDLGIPPGFADNTLVVFEYDHAMVMLESAAMQIEPFPMRRFEVYGIRGSAVMQPLEPPQLYLCLDEDRDGYRKGWQEVSVQWKPRYIDDVIAFVADIRGEKPPDRSLDHEVLVQETLLRATRGLG